VRSVLKEVRERYGTFGGRVECLILAVVGFMQALGYHIDVHVGDCFVLATELALDFGEGGGSRDPSYDLTSLTRKKIVGIKHLILLPRRSTSSSSSSC
jgi:hypothetical protein